MIHKSQDETGRQPHDGDARRGPAREASAEPEPCPSGREIRIVFDTRGGAAPVTTRPARRTTASRRRKRMV